MGVIGAIGSLASAGSSILGGISGSNAFSSAASAAQKYYEQAAQFEKGVYTTAQTNLTPWITGGQTALSAEMAGLGLGATTQQGVGYGTQAAGGTSGVSDYWKSFTQTPYYTFPLAGAEQTMNAQAAAKGLNLSTGQVAQLGNYASGYASQNWSNYMSALNQLSGLGQTASTNLGNIGANIAQTYASTENQQAGTAASGILGSNYALNQGISSAVGNLFGTGSSYGAGGGSGSSTGSSGSSFLTALSKLFGGGGSSVASSGTDTSAFV